MGFLVYSTIWLFFGPVGSFWEDGGFKKKQNICPSPKFLSMSQKLGHDVPPRSKLQWGVHLQIAIQTLIAFYINTPRAPSRPMINKSWRIHNLLRHFSILGRGLTEFHTRSLASKSFLSISWGHWLHEADRLWESHNASMFSNALLWWLPTLWYLEKITDNKGCPTTKGVPVHPTKRSGNFQTEEPTQDSGSRLGRVANVLRIVPTIILTPSTFRLAVRKYQNGDPSPGVLAKIEYKLPCSANIALICLEVQAMKVKKNMRLHPLAIIIPLNAVPKASSAMSCNKNQHLDPPMEGWMNLFYAGMSRSS